MAHVTQMLTQEPILQAFLTFCFKPNLLSALLIYGDNSMIYCLLLFASHHFNLLLKRKSPCTESSEKEPWYRILGLIYSLNMKG